MEKVNHFIYNEPMIPVLLSFLTGLLFSGISWGIVYVVLFLIIWEVIYFGYLSANHRPWIMDDRLLIILAAFLGFLTGAFFHENDSYWDDYKKFNDDADYYGKEFGWFE